MSYTKDDTILPRNVEEEVKESYLRYSMSVIISRALPDVRDGLKPSQRRILYAMRQLNLSPGAKHRKCAKISGDTSGDYHPHGETVIYPTLVRLAQDWMMRYCLINGQGNFGSIDGDPPAAMRYTEARLTQSAMALMEDLDKDTVEMVPNYDETKTEPTDFPTGGISSGYRGIKEAYHSGRGKVILRAEMRVEDLPNNRQQIVVDAFPYNVNKSRLIELIATLIN